MFHVKLYKLIKNIIVYQELKKLQKIKERQQKDLDQMIAVS